MLDMIPIPSTNEKARIAPPIFRVLLVVLSIIFSLKGRMARYVPPLAKG
jgi:hypothetical protein